MFFNLISLLSVASVIISCSSSNKVNPLSGASEEFKTEEAENSLPMDLWSPDKRHSNALYYFFLGEISSYQRNTENSFEQYQTAYNLDPNSFLAYKMIKSGFFNKPSETMVLAKKMTLLYPEDAHLQSLLGQILLSQGYYKKAEKKLKLSLKMDTKIKDSYINLISIYQLTNEIEKAIKISEELISKHPSYLEAYALQTKLYVKVGKNQKALKTIEKSYSFDDSDPITVLLYAYTLELNGKTEQSVAMYEKLVEIVPLNLAITTNMVALYKEMGTLDKSFNLLAELDKKLEGKNRAVKMQMVFIHWELEEFKECVAILEKMISDKESESRESYILGLAYEKTKKFEQAMSIYRKIKPKEKFYFDARYRLSLLLYQSGNKSEAYSIVNTILEEDKFETKESFYKLASSLYEVDGNLEQAILILEKSAIEYPENTNLLFLLGVNYEKIGSKNKCISVMKKIISIDSSYGAAYNYLAYIYAEDGVNLQKAEKLLDKALKLKPNDGYYIDTLGWIYYKQGKYKKALESLLLADKKAPNEAVILEHIADVYIKLNQREKAKSYYEKALKVKLNEKDKKRISEKWNKMSAN